ncbi:MAG: biotin/lipoyl-binding protein [Acidobacteriia bacterium]|nr:biotin/lipoyl-binding protein [Terriglobia bacterium]
MDYEFLADGTTHRISLEHIEGKAIATLRDERIEVDVHWVSPQAVSLLVNGKSYLARVATRGEKIFVAVGAIHFCLEQPKQQSALSRLKEGMPEKAEGTIKAPMPGLVIKVNVTEGDEVDRGDGLVVVEAMKMEHEMRAAFQATVEKVYVKAGQQVDAFQPLVELKPAASGA